MTDGPDTTPELDDASSLAVLQSLQAIRSADTCVIVATHDRAVVDVADREAVFVWADDITARGQPFHRGIEVQVLDLNSNTVTANAAVFIADRDRVYGTGVR